MSRIIERASARHVRLLLGAALIATLGACGGGPADGETVTATPAGAPTPGSAQQIEARVGDATINIVAMQTASIPAEVAREHGIVRSEDLVMLMVSPRQGSLGNLSSAPMQVAATVTDLRGQQQALEMKQVVNNGLIDYVGTVQTQLPDTLRFEVQVATPEGVRETLQLTREFQPGPPVSGN